jgi:two-component system LytT family response regulator
VSRADTLLPISTLVVDDEALARSLVTTLVRRDPELCLAGECADGGEAIEAIVRLKPDLVFLDIQMPVVDGLGVARKLATIDEPPYVIFTTAYDEHAIEAFELNALDYLVKPLQKTRFLASVKRAKTAIRERELLDLTSRLLALGNNRQPANTAETGTELTIRDGESIVQVTTSEIVWVEAANQYVHVHTDSKTFTVSETLSQYSKRIADPAFFRVHRSALVNGRAVVDVMKKPNGTHALGLSNGDTLTLARSRAALVPGILRTARQAMAGR